MKKEDFFEVIGGLDDDIVKGAKSDMKNAKSMKMKLNWKVCGAMAACLCLVATVNTLASSSENNQYLDSGTFDGDPNGYGQTADISPMICVNRALYKISGNQPDLAGNKDKLLYLGEILSAVSSSQKPTEDFQANDDIIGSAVYQYGEDVVVEINGEYWLYELLYNYLR